jgi:hypothetical protein
MIKSGSGRGFSGDPLKGIAVLKRRSTRFSKPPQSETIEGHERSRRFHVRGTISLFMLFCTNRFSWSFGSNFI